LFGIIIAVVTKRYPEFVADPSAHCRALTKQSRRRGIMACPFF